MIKDTANHISQSFDDELNALKQDLIQMGQLVERQVDDAIQALTEDDIKLAEQVRHQDNEVDQLELRIDEECTQLIAKRQPTANDLRLVFSIAKIVNDLERIGDEAEKIARTAIKLSEEGETPRGYVEIRHIGAHVGLMVQDAISAFAHMDTNLALNVMREDSSVDQEYKTAMRSLVTFMMEDARSISRILHVMWVLRALERVGDHARNVAEHVIYIVQGKVVRHRSVEQAERAVDSRR